MEVSPTQMSNATTMATGRWSGAVEGRDKPRVRAQLPGTVDRGEGQSRRSAMK